MGHPFSSHRSCISDVNQASGSSNADCDIQMKLEFSGVKQLGEHIDNPECNDHKMVVVVFKGAVAEEIGRTEIYADSSKSELSWPEKIPVNYRFGANQPLIIHVYDVGPQYHGQQFQLPGQTLLAESCCNMSQIVTANNRTYTFAPEKKQTRWQIVKLTVRAEETVAFRVLSVKFKYCPTRSQIKKGKEGRFLKISKVVNGKHIVICATRPVKSNQNYEWSVSLTKQQIGSKDDELVIEGYNLESNCNPTKFGELQASVSDLESGKVFKGLSVDITESHSFLDYMSSVYKFGFMVAVDFSATNSDLSSNLNSHMQVIRCVGDAIECYDPDQRIPAWGYGGKISIDGETSSCFNLNLKTDNCENHKVEGIMAAYREALSSVKLDDHYDLASVSEVIKKASDYLANKRCKYYVLLIIMDGVSFDVQKTIERMVAASTLPLSILIVGVGDGTGFEKMKNLCADNGHLFESSKGDDIVLRDIVRWVPKCDLPTDEQCMAEILLEGIPKQFCTYMLKEGIEPVSD